MSRSAAIVAAVLLTALGCAAPADPTPGTPRTPAAASDPSPAPGSQPTHDARPTDRIADAPRRDPFELARRLTGVEADPLPVGTLYADEPPGSRRSFRGLDLRRVEVFAFEAAVRRVSPNAVWYLPVGAAVPASALDAAVGEFESRILPGLADLLAPGFVLPGRIAIVHGRFPGLGGYFQSADALPAAVYPNSNERVGLFLHLGIPVGTDAYFGTLTHELQHLIHWHLDPDEEVWIQEGLSEFAARSLSYGALPLDAYRRRPETSLTHWPAAPGASLPNYAAASLFAAYLAERSGGAAAVAAEPLNGAAGVEAVLRERSPGIRFEDVHADWLAANVVGASAPPYGYGHPPDLVNADRTVSGPRTGTVRIRQYGAWHLRIDPRGPLDLTIVADRTTPLLPVPARSGAHCWWGNRGESIGARLTRRVDLTGVRAAVLEFHAWWDIEDRWDHAYVTLSADGGTTWQILRGTRSATDDPLGTAFGPSYTGASGGWRRERIDLGPFAGREILLRFEYVTDDGVHTPGWCIDDVAVPAIGLFDDAETPGEWDADGFVRVGDRGVEQRFTLRLIEGRGDGAVVTPLELGPDGSLGRRIERPATLIVSAHAPKTSEPATVRYRITRAPARP